jgi:hypothetical protein
MEFRKPRASRGNLCFWKFARQAENFILQALRVQKISSCPKCPSGADINHMRREENKPDATAWFIALKIRSTFFGYFCAHHQELETILVLLPHK